LQGGFASLLAKEWAVPFRVPRHERAFSLAQAFTPAEGDNGFFFLFLLAAFRRRDFSLGLTVITLGPFQQVRQFSCPMVRLLVVDVTPRFFASSLTILKSSGRYFRPMSAVRE
jgi:hypothetical protein